MGGKMGGKNMGGHALGWGVCGRRVSRFPSSAGRPEQPTLFKQNLETRV
jgi:hypothetical protein